MTKIAELDLTRGLIYDEEGGERLAKAFAFSIEKGILPQLLRIINHYSKEEGDGCYLRTRIRPYDRSPYDMVFFYEQLRFDQVEKGWVEIFNGGWNLHGIDGDNPQWSSNT